ncbi:hypothetical protein FACS189473_5180 [Spirochaetia bacterium]|nr:hypothetical protein FACS189473_5180 [Spirochaetia bacterium]
MNPEQELYAKSLEIAALMLGPTELSYNDADGKRRDAREVINSYFHKYLTIAENVSEKIRFGKY